MTTKQLIHQCKSHIKTCHAQLAFSSNDPMALVQCRIQIDKLLFQCLKHYANQSTEMKSFIDWVESFQKQHVDNAIDAAQKQIQKTQTSFH